ncbi:MAG: PqqD family protein [Solirubrobacterales bacterium]
MRLRDADLDWREVEGELVALDLRESRYLAVNRSGQVLWAALAEGATRDELVERLVEAFDIEAASAAADVDAFTAELDSRGLLVQKQSDQ